MRSSTPIGTATPTATSSTPSPHIMASKPENILLGAGSGEILDVCRHARSLGGGKKVLGVGAHVWLRVPACDQRSRREAHHAAAAGGLSPGHSGADQERRTNALSARSDLSTSAIRTIPPAASSRAQEIKQLLDGIPPDLPVLIDEAYHHFVDNPDYATSAPYVLQGRPVIVTRTFSKIAALAGMRLGYGLAPADLIRQMQRLHDRRHQRGREMGWSGRAERHRITGHREAADAGTAEEHDRLADDDGLQRDPVRHELLHGRPPPSRNSCHCGVPGAGVLVGRPFPPMMQHLRVSIGTADEMQRFMSAFRQVMT